MTCEFCSSTNFYLSDLPALGPCVCVTPETLVDMRHDLLAIGRERDEAAGIMGEAFDHLAAYLTRIGLSPRAVKLDDPDLDALLKILGD